MTFSRGPILSTASSEVWDLSVRLQAGRNQTKTGKGCPFQIVIARVVVLAIGNGIGIGIRIGIGVGVVRLALFCTPLPMDLNPELKAPANHLKPENPNYRLPPPLQKTLKP